MTENISYFILEMALSLFLLSMAQFYQPFRKQESLLASGLLIIATIGSFLVNIGRMPLFVLSTDPSGYQVTLFSPAIVMVAVWYTDIFLRDTSWTERYLNQPLFSIKNETLTVRQVLENREATLAHDKWIDDQRARYIKPKIDALSKANRDKKNLN